MANTKVIIDADSVEINGTFVYRLQAGCIEKGELQDVYIFLLEMLDPLDPAKDELERICTVADIVAGGFYTNRAQAETAGHLLFRSNAMTKYFDDVQVANDAKTVLQDTINTLVQDYITYSDSYEGVAEEVEFPTTDPTATQALKNTYEDELEAYDTALETQATAASTLDTSQTTYDTAKSQIDKRDSLKVKFNETQSSVSDAQVDFSSYVGTTPGVNQDAAWIVTQIDTFINAYNSSGSGVDFYRDNLESDRNDFEQNRKNVKNAIVDGAFSSTVTDMQTLYTTLDSYFDITDSDLTTAESDLAAAKAAKVEADAAVTATYALLLAAYLAAKAVCPEWSTEAPPPPLSSS